uniref:Ribosomal RNA processing protein 1-like protein n=1 Tax=Heterorhabditis bacteriophora TaxID=37862 RepID=A0A1I7XS14_HETBA
MDVDLESVEIIFAQKLACGEPTTRQRALRALQDWIKEQSASKQFTEVDMLRLCKGLHYVMWMQDKMVLQEELADRISGLFLVFNHESERALFIRSIFKSLSKEWHHIDRWRMDKFLMLMRRVLRALFEYLKGRKWKKYIREMYWQVFQQTTISSGDLKLYNNGYFFCLVLWFSDYLFSSILDEIFVTILHQRSEEIVARMDMGEEVKDGVPGLKFNFTSLGKMLFNIGKNPEVTSRRRSQLYLYAKKFNSAANDCDPFQFNAPVPTEKLTKTDYAKAEETIREMETAFALDRDTMKKGKKCGSNVPLRL